MNKQMIQPKKSQTRFDKAFKQRAVELWVNSDRTVTAVSAELGIRPERLRAWRWGRFAPRPPGGNGGPGAKRSAEQLEAENTDLQRENDYLRQHRDMLKRILRILSETPTNGISRLRR
jgi:transposase-like protein